MGTKKIAILVDDIYEDQEFWYPYLRLKEEGFEVVSVADKAGATYSGKHGYPVKADVAAADANPDEFAAVIIPGGYAPDKMRVKPAMIEFTRKIGEAGKLAAAICHGPWMLVSAGLLKGKRATCYKAIKDDIVNAGAEFVDEEVVVDGNIITSRTPADLPAYLKEIIKYLKV
jgi:protease I